MHQKLDRLGIVLPADGLAQMARFMDLLLNMNRQFNLTAVRSLDPAWQRLVLDSLTFLAALQSSRAGTAVMDIGSGGGVPGIPLAIARPDLRFTLVEAVGKKANFLKRTLGALELVNATALHERAETLGRCPDHRQRYDVAISRAVGAFSTVLEYSMPLLRPGGRVLAMKGPRAEKELAEASNAIAVLGGGQVCVFDAYPDESDSNLVIIHVMKERPTPSAYPRRPGLPKHSPL